MIVSAFPRCTKRDGEFELWTVAQAWLRACALLWVLTLAGSGVKMCQIPALQLFAAALTRYNTASSTGVLYILQACFCLGVLDIRRTGHLDSHLDAGLKGRGMRPVLCQKSAVLWESVQKSCIINVEMKVFGSQASCCKCVCLKGWLCYSSFSPNPAGAQSFACTSSSAAGGTDTQR